LRNQLSRLALKISVSDTVESGSALQGKPPLEELVKTQASSVGLREAVMACVSGRESRIFWSSGAMKEQNEGRVAVERIHYR
jgi:hypothetical protein